MYQVLSEPQYMCMNLLELTDNHHGGTVHMIKISHLSLMNFVDNAKPTFNL